MIRRIAVRRVILPFAVTLFAHWLCTITSSAAHAPRVGRDDQIVAAEAEAGSEAERMGRIDIDQFYQWIFPGAAGPDPGRKRIQAQVKLRLAEIGRICRLTEVQQQKLQLAAQGDLQRFMDQVAEVRRKFEAVENDQNALGQIYQEIQPLQTKQAGGLTGPDSLLMKIVNQTLTPDQASAYTKVVDARRKFQYQASVAVSLTTLESAVPLRQVQREAIAKLMLEETQLPAVSGQHDYQLFMYRLSTLPAEKIRPLLDDRQWQKMQPQFNQYRGLRDLLIQQGVIARDDAEEAKEAHTP